MTEIPVKQTVKQAFQCLKHEQYKEAEGLLSNVLQREPENYDALIGIALCYDKTERDELAKSTFIRATHIKPADLRAWQGLSKFYDNRIEHYPNESNGVHEHLVTLYEINDPMKRHQSLETIASNCRHYLCTIDVTKLSLICKEVIKHNPSHIPSLELLISFAAESFIINGLTNDPVTEWTNILNDQPEECVDRYVLQIGTLLGYLICGQWNDAEVYLNSDEVDLSESVLIKCLAASVFFNECEFLICKEVIEAVLPELDISCQPKVQNQQQLLTALFDMLAETCLLLDTVDPSLLDSSLPISDRWRLQLLVSLDRADEAEEMMQRHNLSPEWNVDVKLAKIKLSLNNNSIEVNNLLDRLMEIEPLNIFQLFLRIKWLLALCPTTPQYVRYRIAIKSCLVNLKEENPLFYGFHLLLGKVYDQSREFVQAEACYREAHNRLPSSVEVCTCLGLMLVKNDKFVDGINILASIDIHSGTKVVWRTLGILYQRENRLDDAYQAFLRLVNMDRSDCVSYQCLGDVLLSKGMYERAIKAFKKAQELHTDSDYAYHQCGKAYLKLKDYDKALEHFNIALRLENSSVFALSGICETHLYRAQDFMKEKFVLQAIAQIHEALPYASLAFEHHSQNIIVVELIGNLLTILHENHDPNLRLDVPINLVRINSPPQILDRAIQTEAKNIDQSLRLGAEFYKLGVNLQPSSPNQSQLYYCLGLNMFYQWCRVNSQSAIQMAYTSEPLTVPSILEIENVLKKAICLHPDNPDYWNLLGTVYAYQNEGLSFFYAQHCFIQSLELDHKHSEATSNLGFLYLKEGKIELAENMFRNGQAYNPENAQCLLGLNRIHNDIIYAVQAASLSTDINVVYHLVRNYFAENRSGKLNNDDFLKNYTVSLAIEKLRKVIYIFPTNYRLWHDLGLLYHHTGNWRSSISAIKRSLELCSVIEEKSIIKYNYMLTKILGGLKDVSEVDLDEPKSLHQHLLKAYVVSQSGDIVGGTALYEAAANSYPSQPSTPRVIQLAIACHEIMISLKHDVRSLGLNRITISEQEENSCDKENRVRCEMLLAATLALNNTEQLSQQPLKMILENVNSLCPNLRAKFLSLTEGNEAALTYLVSVDSQLSWFYAALWTWNLYGVSKADDVIQYLLKSLEFCPGPMYQDCASLLVKVIAECEDESRNNPPFLRPQGSCRLLSIAAHLFPDTPDIVTILNGLGPHEQGPLVPDHPDGDLAAAAAPRPVADPFQGSSDEDLSNPDPTFSD